MYVFLKNTCVVGHLGYFYYSFPTISGTATINFLVHTALIFNTFKLKIMKEHHIQSTELFLKSLIYVYVHIVCNFIGSGL